MSKILEAAWLTLALCGLSISIWRFAMEGLPAAIWFLLLTVVAAIFYSIRRRQRIDEQNQAISSTISVSDDKVEEGPSKSA